MIINRKPLKYIVSSILSILLLIYFHSNVYAQLTLFSDDFNDNNISPNWLQKNYTLEDSGSFSPLYELEMNEIDHEFRISGFGTIDITNLDGQTVGWIGRSLMYKESLSLNQIIEVEAKVKLQATELGYSANLTLEFDEDNRIIISPTDYTYSIGRAAIMPINF